MPIKRLTSKLSLVLAFSLALSGCYSEKLTYGEQFLTKPELVTRDIQGYFSENELTELKKQVYEIIYFAEGRYNIEIMPVDIYFSIPPNLDENGKVIAGRTWYYYNAIQFNPEYLQRSNLLVRKMVFVHEVSHLVDFHLYGLREDTHDYLFDTLLKDIYTNLPNDIVVEVNM